MRRIWSLFFALALLLAACGGRSASNDEATTTNDADTTGSVAENSPGQGDSSSGKKKRGTGMKPSARTKPAAGPQDTSKTSSGNETASSSGNNASTARSGPKPTAPLQEGTYTYDTDGKATVSGGSRQMPEETTLSADAPRDGVQRLVRDLRDNDGNGTVVETHVGFANDGVYLSYVKTTST
ncbi:MAG TPA: hypothetical protein VHJ82_05580, partial [Actinomycetota bacterium]|nr:hypothetical protein [Actinomycetota bacterium]